MTPKERAEDFKYNKFGNFATLVVDEIIKLNPTIGSCYEYNGNGWFLNDIIQHEIDYWQEVKQELEKL